MANRFEISKDDRFALPEQPVINSGAVVVFELLNDPNSLPEQFMDEDTERVFSESMPDKKDRFRHRPFCR